MGVHYPGTLMVYLYLAIAIVVEVIATLMLKASVGFTKPLFGMGAVFFYGIAGMLLAVVLTKMNVGMAYAIWAGAGIALISIASAIIWKQSYDIYGVAGILLIGAGVVLITMKSSVVIQ